MLKEIGDCKENTLIHGGCKGVDLTANKIAEHYGWKIESYPANWKKGRSAGPERNKQMLLQSNPDVVILFIHPLSRGTKNMESLVNRYFKGKVVTYHLE